MFRKNDVRRIIVALFTVYSLFLLSACSSGEKLTQENVDSIIGNGHARGRNTIMYSSYCDNMDYLYFWDDDERQVVIGYLPDHLRTRNT